MLRRPSLALLLGAAALLLATACTGSSSSSRAYQVTSRAELIGGPNAVGEIGDWMLENDRIRLIIHDQGKSRGFAVHGGSLIDMDRARPQAAGGPGGGRGNDLFGESFPIFFIGALVADTVEVTADGSDGGAASVTLSGAAGEFLTLSKSLNQAVLNSHELSSNFLDLLDPGSLDGAPRLRFEVTYTLPPGARYFRVTSKIINIDDEVVDMPSKTIASLLGVLLPGFDASGFDVPMGHVLISGADFSPFLPGIGYDLRFAVDRAADVEGLTFPALPGILSDAIVGTSDRGLSYAFVRDPRTKAKSFVASRVNADGANSYEAAYGVEVTDDTMLIPIVSGSIVATFYAQAPKTLEPGGSFSFSSLYVLGDGDAASALNEVHRLRGVEVGTFRGAVADEVTGAAVEGASVIVYDGAGRPINQLATDASGHFGGDLAPGDYTARVEKAPTLSAPVSFTVRAGQTTFRRFQRPSPGHVSVQVHGASGAPLPAKITLVGTSPAADAGRDPKEYLFDLAAGQSFRTSDLVPDDPDDPETRRYIEGRGFTEGGHVRVSARPGTYDVWISRGPEYDVHVERGVTIGPGQTAHVAATLERVVDSTGWVAADLHVHSAPSPDSDVPLDERVLTTAAEAIEIPVATDHNVVTDLQPAIDRLGMQAWLKGVVGLELTTLEAGHFNAFPLRRDPAAITKGSFLWTDLPAQEIFDRLRELGDLGASRTVVQVNHPRDSALGYWSQHDLDPLTAEILPATGGGGLDFGRLLSPNGPAFFDAEGNSVFSTDYDAVELLNGKRLDLIRHLRVPASLDGLDIPEEVAAALTTPGAILCEDGEVLWPGAVDDWFHMLNVGLRYTGTGNSDSHHDDDMGFPRTWLAVPNDDPLMVTSADVADAVLHHRAVSSYAPLVDFTINGAPVGSDVDANGAVTWRVVVQAAPWVDVDSLRLIENGRVIDEVAITRDDGVRFEFEGTLNPAADSWYVVEVEGDGSLFPVMPPLEIPPIQIAEALSTIAGPLGFGGADLGDLQPGGRQQVTAYAITNPIWVDLGGDGFTPPGNPARACEPADGIGLVVEQPVGETSGALETVPRALRPTVRPPSRLLRSYWFPRARGDVHDIRTLFDQFHIH